MLKNKQNTANSFSLNSISKRLYVQLSKKDGRLREKVNIDQYIF